jgi:tetratricopeptide (TPR) repeat protein
MKPARLRVFVSSPGDVNAARELVAQVIEKLAHDYARFYTVEPYLWEYEPMLASGHFQDSIDPPSQFDAVILILESRLGTPLPERTAVREYRGIDGRTPVTGTEWEYEDALTAARARGLPDLLVYRSQRNAEISTRDPESRRAVIAQIEALDVFWSRHFADRGSFIGAFAEFKTLDEFAAKVEKDLRRCLERRIEALDPEQRTARPRLWAQDPFRGLESYEFEHARILFGRDSAIGTALLRLITNAAAGTPFLLVSGASGSGKSSLVKAGIVPRLLVPQRVTGSAFLRRVIFRASDMRADEDLCAALARCLTHDDHAGHVGLPELLGHGMPVGQFAQHLRAATAHPDLPFAMVLDRLAEEARAQGRILRYQQAKLVLIVDQLEEIYTGERITPEERRRFIELLAALARSGLVWVIATLRSDFWHRAAETPELLRLADGDGRLDLLPPSPAELSQMIRAPAEAAAISFETHPSTGIPLNDVIAEQASSEPGVLPLLSYLLDQLYRRDVQHGAGTVLTYASNASLGGLKGAIATRADEVLAARPQEERQALRPVLFALVQISSAEGNIERAVARRAALADFPPGTAKRRLIDALIDPAARLLVADDPGGAGATVRLAHEALISEWQTARDYVRANAEALRTRRLIEERYARWRSLNAGAAAASGVASQSPAASPAAGAAGHEHALLTDIDLTDAMRLLKDYRGELSPELIAYIERSSDEERRRRRRLLRIVSGVAVVMSLLAVGAAFAAYQAFMARNLARGEATTAERTTRFLVSLFDWADPGQSRGAAITAREVLDRGTTDIRHGLESQPSVRAELLTAMGQAYTGLGLYPQAEQLLAQARQDQRTGSVTDESRVRTLVASGAEAYLDGHYDQAVSFLRPAADLARRSLPATSVTRSAALTTLADARVAEGLYPEAIRLCLEALAADRMRQPPDDAVRASTLNSLGNAYFFSGDLAAAEPPFREALRLRQATFGENHPRTAESLENLAALLYQTGRYREAAERWQAVLPIFHQVYGPEHPEVATLLSNIGRALLMMGEWQKAEPVLRQALAMTEKFEGAQHDDLTSPLNSLAMIDEYRGDLTAARSEIGRAETIARLREHNDLLDQVLLNEADIEFASGNPTRAGALLDESRTLLQKNYPRDAGNAWRYALWDSVNAERLAAQGNDAAARSALAAANPVILQRFGPQGFYSLQALKRSMQIERTARNAP